MKQIIFECDLCHTAWTITDVVPVRWTGRDRSGELQYDPNGIDAAAHHLCMRCIAGVRAIPDRMMQE